MASSLTPLHSLSVSPSLCKPQTQNFLSCNSISTLKKSYLRHYKYDQFALLNPKPKTRNPCSVFVVSAAQSKFTKVVQTVWRVSRDVVEAGTNVVPESVPRPIARISVTVVAVAVSLFVLKQFLSTAFFVLATMGLAYFIFLALNKNQGPRGGGGGGGGAGAGGSFNSSDDPVEEARRIMEKYKYVLHFSAIHGSSN